MIPKTPLLFGLLFFTLLLPLTLGNIIDIEPKNFNLTLNLSSSEDFSFRITHTNSSVNLTTPVNIYYQGIIPIYFDKNNFTLITSQNIYINTSVHSNLFRSGDYKGMIFIQTQNETHELPININIIPTTLFEMETNATNMTLDQGDVGVFYFNITNLGNTKLYLFMETPSIFHTAETINIPVGMSLSVPLYYDIPSNFSSGYHELSFDFNGKIFLLNLSIVDKITPLITIDKNLSKEVFVLDTIKFEDYVFCEDNEKISSFTYEINNKTHNITKIFNFEEIGTYEFKFSCLDNYLNGYHTTKIINAIPIEITQLKDEIIIPKKKSDESIYLDLFSISNKLKANVKIELVPDKINPNTNISEGLGDFDIKIISNDRSKFLEDNTSTEFTTEGDVFLQLSNFEDDAKGNYSGTISFDYGELADNSKFEIEFNGEIGSYSVRDPFNLSIYDSVLKCYGVDTGSGSKVICDGLEFPSDINSDSYVVPRTQSQMSIQEKLCQAQIDNEISNTNFYKYILWGLGFIAFVIGVILFLIKAKGSYHD